MSNQGFYGFPNPSAVPQQGIEITDGTHDVAPTAKITVSGAVVGGASPNATLTFSPGMANPMTAEGSLIQGGVPSAGTAPPVELPLGRSGQEPQPVGSDVAWITPCDTGGYASPATTDGDLVVRKAAIVTSLALSWIGDSNVANNPLGGLGGPNAPPGQLATLLTSMNANGATVTCANEGIGGTATPDWLSGAGSGYLVAAVSRAVTAGAKAVIVTFGTNDSDAAVNSSAATFFANMQNICTYIVSQGLIAIVTYPVYMFRTSSPYQSTSPALVLSYLPYIDRLRNGSSIRLGDTTAYALLKARVASDFQSDNLHVNLTGATDWATQVAAALLPFVNLWTGEVTNQRMVVGAGLTVSAVAGVQTLKANVTAAGAGELLMQNGVTFPPVPLTTEDGSDWLYSG